VLEALMVDSQALPAYRVGPDGPRFYPSTNARGGSSPAL
jgi:hypothetical protein